MIIKHSIGTKGTEQIALRHTEQRHTQSLVIFGFCLKQKGTKTHETTSISNSG